MFNLEDYEPIEERLARFWNEHKEGRILTELVKDDAGEWVIRAEVWLGDTLKATGYAHKRDGSSVVNKTSALENCETSAVGRALANLGYAPKGQRASREEMTKAAPGEASGGRAKKSNGQGGRRRTGGTEAPTSAAQQQDIARLVDETGYDLAAFLKGKNIASADKLSFDQAERLIEFLLDKRPRVES